MEKFAPKSLLQFWCGYNKIWKILAHLKHISLHNSHSQMNVSKHFFDELWPNADHCLAIWVWQQQIRSTRLQHIGQVLAVRVPETQFNPGLWVDLWLPSHYQSDNNSLCVPIKISQVFSQDCCLHKTICSVRYFLVSLAKKSLLSQGKLFLTHVLRATTIANTYPVSSHSVTTETIYLFSLCNRQTHCQTFNHMSFYLVLFLVCGAWSWHFLAWSSVCATQGHHHHLLK